LENRLRGRLGELKGRERLLAADLGRFDLRQMMRLKRETVGSQFSRLQAGARLFLQSARGQVQALDNSLQALSPLAVLDRGYAICRDVRGNIVKDATILQPGDSFVRRPGGKSRDRKKDRLE
jgi:exodeoxyribonuclease VII large subunit